MSRNPYPLVCSLLDNIDISPSDIIFVRNDRIDNLTFWPRDSVLFSLPEQRGAVHFPPGYPGISNGRMLNDYYEKEIGGVHYRVHSIFGSEGDFQKLSEKLLESRVVKHHGKSCAGDAAGS